MGTVPCPVRMAIQFNGLLAVDHFDGIEFFPVKSLYLIDFIKMADTSINCDHVRLKVADLKPVMRFGPVLVCDRF